MEAIIDKTSGLRTERRMSHVYVLDVPTYTKPLLITDGAINIYPDLTIKRDIVQNAIDLALALGKERPKVAILSAVETVNPRITATLDAAALCKMADRGQITGGLIDGPLAFDNAVSPMAVAAKGIVSDVAGIADILVAPDLEAANMIAKQLIYLAGADAAGIVLGARVPIILTSRSDSKMSRRASCALSQLFINHQQNNE
jgi:phosphotransacetylase